MISRGEWPLWNEFLYGGYSYFGSPTHEAFSPLTNLPYLLLPSFWAALATITAALTLSLVGAFRLTRIFSDDEVLCFAFGLAYCFLGPTLSLIDRSSLLCSVALYPWIAWCVCQWTRKVTWRSIALWSIFVAGTIHHLDWAGTIVAIGLTFLFCVFQDKPQRGPTLRAFTLGLILITLLSAVVVLPVIENLPFTSRGQGLSYSENSEWSLHPARVLQMLAPELWGSPYNNTFWGRHLIGGQELTRRFWFHSLYLSLPLLVLSFYGIWTLRRSRFAMVAIGFSIFLFLMALGANFPLHPWAFEHFPALAKFRYPEKFVLFPVLILAAFSIFGLTKIRTWKNRDTTIFWLVIAGLHLLTPLLVTQLLHHSYPSSLPNVIDLSVTTAKHLHWFLGALAALIAAIHFQRKINSVVIQSWALLIFIGLDLILFAPAVKTVRWSTYTDQVRLLDNPKLQNSTGRWMVDRSNLFLADGRQILTYDWGLLSDIRILTAYDAILPDRRPDSIGEILDHLPGWTNALNLQFLITGSQYLHGKIEDRVDQGLLHLAHTDPQEKMAVYQIPTSPGEISLYEKVAWVSTPEAAKIAVQNMPPNSQTVVLENPSPIAFENSESQYPATFEVKTHQHNFRKILVHSDHSLWLVMRQSYHLGWQAFVNGEKVSVYPANFSSIAIPVRVSPGQSLVEVRLKFSSPAFYWGLALFIVGMIMAVVGLAFEARFKRFFNSI